MTASSSSSSSSSSTNRGYKGSKYSGYYEPTPAQITHLLDGTEPVTRKRTAAEVLHAMNQPRHREDGSTRPVLYPQIDRSKAAEHGLFLVHTVPMHDDDFNGDLVVTGDRLTEITAEQKGEFVAKYAASTEAEAESDGEGTDR